MRLLAGVLAAAVALSGVSISAGGASATPGTRPVLRVETDATLSLRSGRHDASELDRDRYFRLYHFPGMFDEALVEEMKRLRVTPGRGTGPYFPKAEPGSEAYAADDARVLAQHVEIFRRAAEQHPGIWFASGGKRYPRTTVAAAGGKESPETVDPSMRVDPNVVLPQDYELAAAALSGWFTGLKAAGAPVPRYFSPINEPDAMWRDGARSGRTHAEFSRVLATRLQADHPDVRFTGPCTAWSHPGPRWGRWSSPAGMERQFIDHVGDLVDAYDFHLYTKELWAHVPPDPKNIAPGRVQPDARLFESLPRGHNEVWDFGKAEMVLDLVKVLHEARWSTPAPPVVITEFGRQGIAPQLGPWGNPEYFAYLYAATTTRLWMTFMDRPEITLTVPFILPVSDIGYGDRRGQAMYTRPGSPGDPTPVVTPMRDFIAFFRDLEGARVPATWHGVGQDRRHGLFVVASRTDDAVLVLLHNAPSTSLEFAIELPGGVVPAGATIRRMRWEGPVPEKFTDPTPPGGRWRQDLDAAEPVTGTAVTLAGEETALLRIPVATAPTRHVVEARTYAPRNLTPLAQGETPTEFEIELTPADLQGVSGATAVVGFAAPLGGTPGQSLKVTVNGTPLAASADLGVTAGWRAASLPFRLEFPPTLLRPGRNVVTFTPGPAGLPADALITTLRLDLRSESAAVR